MSVAESALNASERQRIQDILDLCRTARAQLGSDGSFRTRTLLDMLLIELGKELERLAQRAAK